MSIAWVTSWNKDLLRASGTKLINTFYERQVEGHLFIGAEDVITMEKTLLHIPAENKATVGNLETSIYLKEWLKHNEDIIPERLGGIAQICQCKDPWARSEKKHQKGCHHTWFNRNASLWFRKIATMYEVIKLFDNKYKYLVWIDSDCIFKKKIDLEFIDSLANNFDVVYLKGTRPIMEAGFVIYNLRKYGHTFLNKLFGYYQKDFRSLVRWDDSYVIQKLLFNDLGWRSCDIGGNLLDHSDVVPLSLIGQHITHFKGTHGRKLGIMK